MNIYVGNLSYSASEEELKDLFGAYGDVSSATIIKDKMTGRSRGFGFVEMPDDSQGEAAIEALNEQEMNGRRLVVNQARPREERPRRSFDL
jgi:RNA recognition motif-containing protein